MLKNRLQNLSNREVLGILIAVALASSGLSFVVNIVNNVDTSPAWLVSWLQNFSTEMFGAFLTFILLELVVGGRQQREAESKAERLQRDADLKAEQQLKQRLIIQMRSKDNGIALHGLEELREHGWLKDGSLQGVHLRDANLQGANLLGANLQGAYLRMANLQGAELFSSNLQGADLLGAKLQGAKLWGAKLQGAKLSGLNSNRFGRELMFAEFDEKTILPDNSHWTLDTDMTKFTQSDNEAGSA
jgi:hypothetical protein